MNRGRRTKLMGLLMVAAAAALLMTPYPVGDSQAAASERRLSSGPAVLKPSAPLSLGLRPLAAAPVANDDSATTNEDTPVTIDVLANDTDADAGDTLTVDSVTQPANGSVVINGDDTVTYTPAANFNGSDSFTYTAKDSTNNTDTATVTVTVNAVNDAPVASDDPYSVDEDATLTVAAPGVLANDTDVENDPLTAVLVTNVSNGSLTLNADGSFTYEPAANFFGTDSFTYKAHDGTADSNTATVTITVNPVNDPPVAADDSYSVDEDNTLSVAAPGVLTNDTDVDGDTLTAVLVTNVSNGTLTFNANGSFTYTPSANFNGADSFTYTVSDGNGGTDTATVTITVNPVNDAPVASDDPYSVDEDATLTVAAPGVLANDTDVENDPLTAVLVTNVSNGSLTLNADGSFTYEPAANFNGTDSFTYKAHDGTADSNTATVTITVNPVNDAPEAQGKSVTVTPNSSVTITLDASDIDGDTLTYIIVTRPDHGTLKDGSTTISTVPFTLSGNTVTYLPNPNFPFPSSSGADRFRFKANDGQLDSNEAIIDLKVQDGLQSSPFKVTTTEDADTGGCTHAHCTLREAINAANGNGGATLDTIQFNIPQSEFVSSIQAYRIRPKSPLPQLSFRVVIDGTTQPGFDPNNPRPLIYIDGKGLSGTEAAIRITSGAGGSTVRGLTISFFDRGSSCPSATLCSAAIEIAGGGNNTIAGNYLGVNPLGTTAEPNRLGIVVRNSTGNTIGGTTPADRNVISGDAIVGSLSLGRSFVGIWIIEGGSNVIQGNFIGTDATGTQALGNEYGIVFHFTPGNTIGGTTPEARNVISANRTDGIIIVTSTSDGNLIQGNYIGTDVTGTADRGNGSRGIGLHPGVDNTVIGNNVGIGAAPVTSSACVAPCNIIAFNRREGVTIFSNGNTVLSNSFLANGLTAIALASGANGGIQPPDIAAARADPNSQTISVRYRVNLDPGSSPHLVEFYLADDDGQEGRVLLGRDSYSQTDFNSGFKQKTLDVSALGIDFDEIREVVATVTSAAGNTSQFSPGTALNAAQTFKVNSTADRPDSDLSDFSCDTGQKVSRGSGLRAEAECTLRAAIQQANFSLAGLDSIIFDIPVPADPDADPSYDSVTGVFTISPASALPLITDPVVLDATTQPGYSGTPLVQLNGANAGAGASGLEIVAGNATVKGFAINRFRASGILIRTKGGNVIQANFIGTDATGTKVQDNTDPDNVIPLRNGGDGIRISRSPNNTIGGPEASQRNVVSGNGLNGVAIFGVESTGNVVQGNHIGADVTGTLDLGNSADGVSVRDASGATISRNVVAFNRGRGILVAAGEGNRISANSVFSNRGLGIDLGNDGPTLNDAGDADNSPSANRLQNYPVLELVHILSDLRLDVRYRVDSSTQHSAYPLTIEFFKTGPGGQQGKTFLGSHTYTAQNAQSIRQVILGSAVDLNLVTGDFLVATATDAAGNTSEFSIPLQVTSSGGGRSITINSTGDLGDADTGDGVCSTGNTLDSGAAECTLRAAIQQANVRTVDGQPGLDTIKFDIPLSDPSYDAATGAFTIRPASPLPAITDPVIIDGTSQPGYRGTPLIELNGEGAGASASGLRITAGNSLVQGLAINGFARDGIQLEGSGGSFIRGNFIGTDVTGSASKPNFGAGIRVRNSSNNTIGGTAPSSRNVISGNGEQGVFISGSGSTGNRVLGNLIGTKVNGQEALRNGFSGVRIEDASSNTIGGTAEGARNIISGNGAHGVFIRWSGVSGTQATGNVVQGNYIGTDASGTLDLGNSGAGVRVDNASSNTIGGSAAGAGNVIAFNLENGVVVARDPGAAFASSALGNAILSNSIFSNEGVGIRLDPLADQSNDPGDADTGPNNRQNFPVVSLARIDAYDNLVVQYSVDSTTANSAYPLKVQLFEVTLDADGSIDSMTFIGEDVYTAPGTKLGTIPGASAKGLKNEDRIVATATDASSNTSPYSTTPTVVSDAVIWVTSTASSGTGTLRAAIDQANTTAWVDRIRFNVTGPILVTTELPALTSPVVIDGIPDTGFTGTPTVRIEWRGSGSATGLRIHGGGSTVQGLDIREFSRDGIEVFGPGGNTIKSNLLTNNTGAGVLIVSSSDNVIGGLGKRDGNRVTGQHAFGVRVVGQSSGNVLLGNDIVSNEGIGVSIDNGRDNTIGGTEPGAANVIRQNTSHGVRITGSFASGNRVLGNLIGTSAAGTADEGNIGNGVYITGGADNNTIGGTTAEARNIISGNQLDGVLIEGSGTTSNKVLGNFIGTAVDGASAIGNTQAGVRIASGATGNTIGGAGQGARNVISSNLGSGVIIEGSVTSGNAVLGNYIGTDASGVSDLGNQVHGVFVNESPSNSVGGSAPGEGNLVSGNGGDGIHITGAAAQSNSVRANLIGTDAAGTAAVGNTGSGVTIGGSATGNRVGGTGAGEGNVIAFNNGAGLTLASAGNTVLSNSVHSNGGAGIVASGTGHQPAPIVANARVNAYGNLILDYSVVSGAPALVEFFKADASGEEGMTLLGRDTYTSTGDKRLKLGSTAELGIAAGEFIVATATDQSGAGSTSAFSAGRQVSAQAVFTVTTNQDSGPGSLREAITSANASEGADRITFSLDASSRTISLASPLPPLTDPVVIEGPVQDGRVVLDGTGAGSGADGLVLTREGGDSLLRNLVIVGFDGNGVVIEGSPGAAVFEGNASGGTVLEGNYIGTDESNATDRGNGGAGILIVNSRNNLIGGAAPQARNVISGNKGDGVRVTGISSTGNRVQGNHIGADAAGTGELGNGGHGVLITGLASQNVVGASLADTPGEGCAAACNVIAFNDGAGVLVRSGQRNTVRANSIFANGGAGIDLAAHVSQHGLQPAPTFEQAAGQPGPAWLDAGGGLLVRYRAASGPGGAAYPVRVEFFRSSASSELLEFLGADTYTEQDARGVKVASLGSVNVSTGDSIVATATGSDGVTSGLSALTAVTAYKPLLVTSIEDSGSGTLRQAIATANQIPGADRIEFDLDPTSGLTVQLASPLTVTGAVDIDGATQPGYAGTPLITLDGADAVDSAFVIAASGVSIHGLTITGFPVSEISVEPGYENPTLIDVLDGAGQSVSLPPASPAPPPAPPSPVVTLAFVDAAGHLFVRYFVNASPSAAAYPLEVQFFKSGSNTPVATHTYDAASARRAALVELGEASTLNVAVGNTLSARAVDASTNASGHSQGVTVRAAGVITVTSAADSGPGTLRDAIRQANADPGLDFVQFNIGAGGAVTISLDSALPSIDRPLVIDGTTQPGYAGSPLIRLDGASAGQDAIGLLIAADGSAVLGLAVTGFSGPGVVIDASSSAIGGAALGDGSAVSGNGGDGVLVQSGTGNAVLSSAIHSNGGQVIAFGAAPNGQSQPPAIQSARIDADRNLLVTFANATAGSRLDFYVASGADGKRFLGSATASQASGVASLGSVSVAANEQLVAASTDAQGSTSEFSAAATVLDVIVLTVNSLRDLPDQSTSDGQCATGSLTPAGQPECTLRAAIQQANATDGADRIEFNIPVAQKDSVTGQYVIRPGQALPAITGPLEINGASQPDFAGKPVIAVLGGSAGQSTHGLVVQSGGVTVKSIAISGFSGSGILVAPPAGAQGGVTVEGNAISANGGDGVTVQSGSGNRVTANAISANAGKGITLVPTVPGGIEGANHLQPAPVINSARLGADDILVVEYKFDPALVNPALPLRIEFFKADSDGTEGEVFLGSASYDGSHETATAELPNIRELLGSPGPGALAFSVLATATDSGSSTSEFSASLPVEVAEPFIVTSRGDSGVGTLRWAIIEAENRDGTDRIEFNIPANERDSNTGTFVIELLTSLPTIDHRLIIDGTTQPGFSATTRQPVVELDGSATASGHGLHLTAGRSTVKGLVIRGFKDSGIFIQGGDGNIVQGNAIGSASRGNGGHGIHVQGSSDNLIGGTAAGAGNTVAGNDLSGVFVESGTGNAIWRNSIFANGGSRISLGASANNQQAAPDLSGLVVDVSGNLLVDYQVPVSAGFPLRVEFFKSDAAGQLPLVFLGSDEYAAAGPKQANLGKAALAGGDVIIATATDAASNTSAFSAPLPSPADVVSVTKTAPSSVAPGGSITYTITVTNHSSGAITGVAVTDTLPSAVTVTSVQGGDTPGTYDSDTGTWTGDTGETFIRDTGVWTIGDIAGGQARALKITVSVPSASPPPSVTNTVSLSLDQGDPILGNNNASVTTTISTGGGGGGGGGTPIGGGGGLPLAAAISVNPLSLSFTATEGGAAPEARTFGITGIGPAPIAWSAASNFGWVSLSPSSGSVSGGPAPVTVSVNPEGLSAGTHSAIITVTAPGAEGSPQQVNVTFTVLPRPQIATDPAQLTFNAVEGGQSPAPRPLLVWNAAPSRLNWTASASALWLKLEPVSGLSTGESNVNEVLVSVDVSGLTAGVHETVITISGGEGVTPRRVNVTLNLAQRPPALATDAASFTLFAVEGEPHDDPAVLAVWNAGGGLLEWSVTVPPGAPWLRPTPASGTSSGPSDRASVALSVDTTGISAGEYETAVTVSAVGALGSPLQFPVRLSVVPPSDADGDGVPDRLESRAPNGGDANGDGVPDMEQPNVASLPGPSGGQYITLAAPAGMRFQGVRVRSTPPGPVPPEVSEFVEMPSGFIEFTLAGLEPGDAPEVVMTLHGQQPFNAYYNFGPTPEVPTAHWYDFRRQGDTGAVVEGNVIRLRFVDGQRGDDLRANGRIVTLGAPGRDFRADLSLRLSGLPSAIIVGQAVEFHLIVSNGGPSSARNVTLQGAIPEGLGLVSIDPSQGVCVRNPSVQCTLSTLPSGGTVTIVVLILAQESGDFTLSASIRSSNVDPDASNNAVSHALSVTQPVMALSSQSFSFTSVEGNPPLRGQTLQVQNAGTGTLRWRVQPSCGAAGGQAALPGWLKVTPASGSAAGDPASATVMADISGLSPGTYPGRFALASVDSPDQCETISVSLQVLAATGRPRQASVNLQDWERQGIGAVIASFFRSARAGVSDPAEQEWLNIADALASAIESPETTLRPLETPSQDRRRATASLSMLAGTIGRWGPGDAVPASIGDFSVDLARQISAILRGESSWDNLGIMQVESVSRNTLYVAYHRQAQLLLVHLDVFEPVPGQIDAVVPVTALTDPTSRLQLNQDQPAVRFLRRSPMLRASLRSPGELRVMDEVGRITGKVGGQEMRLIPSSAIIRDQVVVLLPSDRHASAFRYEVAATDTGPYGIEVRLVTTAGRDVVFQNTETVRPGEVHVYSVAWDPLSPPESWNLRKDVDGDGRFDSRFSAQEARRSRVPGWVWPEAVIGLVVFVLVVALIIWLLSKWDRKPPWMKKLASPFNKLKALLGSKLPKPKPPKLPIPR